MENEFLAYFKEWEDHVTTYYKSKYEREKKERMKCQGRRKMIEERVKKEMKVRKRRGKGKWKREKRRK